MQLSQIFSKIAFRNSTFIVVSFNFWRFWYLRCVMRSCQMSKFTSLVFVDCFERRSIFVTLVTRMSLIRTTYCSLMRFAYLKTLSLYNNWETRSEVRRYVSTIFLSRSIVLIRFYLRFDAYSTFNSVNVSWSSDIERISLSNDDRVSSDFVWYCSKFS